MSAHDNATPIRIIHNSAGHLNGPARSLGAILIGYLGNYSDRAHVFILVYMYILCLLLSKILVLNAYKYFVHLGFFFTGVRTFCPRPVAKMLENIGGASALLGLVAMATDVEELYAAVKALVCVVKSNKPILKDMERISGYQVCITARND